ncbi:MAG: hypothetical protein UT50_C0001G0018 [Candidatus Moranbacteria bacterium GW2011_GWA2_39_41]|nr:MAG: hypothetical protein UT50_C0001G0018 [Candidatus Moranbacteria bacterium GW2011_GWA2_39_41]
MFPQIKFSAGPKTIILYKLLNDSLLVLLTFFMLTLLAEGALPGVVSTHIGLYKIVIMILLNVLAITGIGKVIKVPEKASNKKIVETRLIASLLIICALLLFNSLLKLNIFLNIFILITLFVTSYFLIRVFQED